MKEFTAFLMLSIRYIRKINVIFIMHLKNSLISYEHNTEEITAVKEFLYVIHVYFHKIFALIFSAYTTSIMKILLPTN